MVKGVSIKFKSYAETVPKLLSLIKFNQEIKNHESIVLKPSLRNSLTSNTPAAFVEEVVKFCVEHKNPSTKIFIAEGSDGEDTMDVFDRAHYKQLAEKYNVSLVDLNTTETEETHSIDFLKFSDIQYPRILKESYVIALPRLSSDPELEMQGSLSTMLGAFPAMHYTGFFSSKKSKIRKWPIRFAIHDIIRCKMPDFTITDASDYGTIIVGKPLEADKQGAKAIGKDWKTIQHLRLLDESLELSQKAAELREVSRAKKKAQEEVA